MNIRPQVSDGTSGTSVAIIEVKPTMSGERVVALVQDVLHDYCAAYVRGLGIIDANHFRRFLGEAGVDALNYRQGNSPRLSVTDGVYTSTEYPAAYEISLHNEMSNEMSYATTWPSRLYFCCLVPPRSGGQSRVLRPRRVLVAMS
jgi:hypothetical protein